MYVKKGQLLRLIKDVEFDTPYGYGVVPAETEVTVYRVGRSDTGIFTTEKFKCEDSNEWTPIFVNHGDYEVIEQEPLNVFIVRQEYASVLLDKPYSVVVVAHDAEEALYVAERESGLDILNCEVEKVNLYKKGTVMGLIKKEKASRF